MKVSCYTGGMVATNGYLVETPDGNFVVDAPEGMADWIAAKGVRVDEVLLTHQHYDHVQGVAAFNELGAKVSAFAHYSTDLTLETAARDWGMPIVVHKYKVDELIDAMAPIVICDQVIRVAHVPGHSTDSITFYLKDEGLVFAGDTLFAGSVGRTDLPGGSTEQLISGVKEHLLTLPPETRVLSGHGPETTIGQEASTNPFL